jgi:hypothetical protein
MILSLILQLGWAFSLAHAADGYEIEYRPYNSGTMREEVVYRVDGPNRVPVQRRIYTSDNELREASFLQKNGKWAGYGDTNLPRQLSMQILAVNNSSPKRSQVKSLPPKGEFDRTVAPGALGNPVSFSVPRAKAPEEDEERSLDSGTTNIVDSLPGDRNPTEAAETSDSDAGAPGGIRCEAGDGEFVICSGVIYRRDRTGSIIQALRTMKIESRSGPNGLGRDSALPVENPFSSKSAQ